MNKSVLAKTMGAVAFLSTIFALQVNRIIPTENLLTSVENGWMSIFTGQILHSNLNHLISNISYLILCVPILLTLYKKDFNMITFLGMLLPSVAVYILDKPELGISGLVYTYAWFIIFGGMSSKNIYKFTLSLVFVALGIASLNGAIPTAFGVNWWIHGAGVLTALAYSLIRSKDA